ncbi:MAG: hypothetical protein ABW092_02990 [Candidatus Thiodiazotropha sp.]
MRIHPTTRAVHWVIASLLIWIPGADAATPYLPNSAESIVARLGPVIVDSRVTRQGPAEDITQAREEALAYIEHGKRSGDARYFGYALGILLQWQDTDPYPEALRLPMAMAQQALHRFDMALDNLQIHLARQADDIQAWLTQAVIKQVQGDYPAARSSCEQLLGRASTLVVVTCTTGTERYTIHAATAYRALRSAIENATAADSDTLGWSLLVLAELAEINADVSIAEKTLYTALQRGGNDTRPLTSLADLLLRQGNSRALLTLIAPDNPLPALRLRRLLALQQAGDQVDETQLAWLRHHFAAGERRERPLHQRDAAIASLYLFDDPQRALDLALSNWEDQREFADIEILLSAALVSGNRTRVRAQLAWLDEMQVMDPRLDRLRHAMLEDHDDVF